MPDSLITFGNVSRFYGEVLGINKVSLAIPPGITSLVGPNGSGKTTLMNLMTGLIRPTQGEIRVLGITPDHPEKLCRIVGYCAQFDAFPKASAAVSLSTLTCASTATPTPSASPAQPPPSSAST
jgi:ABC-2 type transport system ATP-binding protein